MREAPRRSLGHREERGVCGRGIQALVWLGVQAEVSSSHSLWYRQMSGEGDRYTSECKQWIRRESLDNFDTCDVTTCLLFLPLALIRSACKD